ncbi:MAG: class I SAM-dependent methyltransferase [Candidatus Saliniplasma sp.]
MSDFWDDFEDYPLKEEYDICDFIEKIKNKIDEEFKKLDNQYHPAILGENNGAKLYSLIREQRPEMVVETGVCNGFSSSLILKALSENAKGKLYSIDLPKYIEPGEEPDGRTGAVVPSTKYSGWTVPDEFRSSWTHILGNTFYETPRLMERLSEIDIFIHDSDHSYEGMMFEFSIAWKHLKDGGLLMADNIDHSDAFADFAEAKDRTKYRLGVMGLLIK